MNHYPCSKQKFVYNKHLDGVGGLIVAFSLITFG